MLLGNPPMKASRSFSVFGTMLGHMTDSYWNLLCWAYAFHQDKASSVRVPVANVTLVSSALLLERNTDLVRVNNYEANCSFLHLGRKVDSL
ncbi:hypothetical protein Tco_0779912 [Tanacetum coccineum]